MIYGVPQGLILGPLLFLVFILSEAILAANDTNLFYSHNNVKELFRTMNAGLNHLNSWFCAYKLSLNAAKTKYVFFHKANSKDKIVLVLLDLYINYVKIKSENTLKFSGVMIDKNLTWETLVEVVENKCQRVLEFFSKQVTL